MAKLDGKIALITGGTTGIGAATAKLFQAEGATVVVTGANPKTAEAAKAELPGIEVILSDQGDASAAKDLIEQVVAKHGRIDVAFVNAGVAAFAPLEAVDEAFFDRQFDINVKGAFFVAQAAAAHIPAGGTIIFTASTAASSGMAAGSVYAATKAAVRSFARSLGAELAPKGVRVNAISPGPIETPIFGKSGMPQAQMDAFMADIQKRVPLGRIGRADEIAAAVLYLAADATYVTGEEIISGGGLVVI